jgi:hypothetical protein
VPPRDRGLHRAVDQDSLVGQLAPALGRVGEERPGAALDVDPAVVAGRPGLVAELVQFLLARHDRVGEVLQHEGALVEGHPPQRRPPTRPAMVEHGPEIEAAAAGLGEDLAGHRAAYLCKRAVARNPAVAGIVEQLERLHRQL